MKQKIKTALPGILSSTVALFGQHFFCCILPKVWPGLMAWLMSALGLEHDAVTVLIVSVILTWVICTAHFFVRQARAQKHACHCPSHCCDGDLPKSQSLLVRYFTDTELRYSLFFVVIVNAAVFAWEWWG